MAYSPKTPAELFEETTSSQNLHRIYIDYVAGTSARGRDGIAPRQLYENIDDTISLISRRLKDGSYTFTQYRELLVPKGAESFPRVLSIPTARDRIVLRAITEFLGQVYPFGRGEIPQVRIAGVADTIASSRFNSYVRLDVKRFYPSIQHSSISKSLRVRIRKPEILNVIERSIATPTVPDGAKKRPLATKGLPQGLSVSNILAELAVHPIDKFFEQQSRCAYFRFVDDILILCDASDIDDIRDRAHIKFIEKGLTLHGKDASAGKSSSGSIEGEIEYLGYVFKNGTVSVRAASIKRLESSVARIFTRYKKESVKLPPKEALRRCQRLVNLRITGCIYNNVARGWIHYFRQMNDLSLAKRLDAMVARFRKRFDVPAELSFKSFTRSYWESQRPHRNDAKYIPNYDRFGIEEKREFLTDILGGSIMENMGDKEVEHRFGPEVNRIIAGFEHDIGAIS